MNLRIWFLAAVVLLSTAPLFAQDPPAATTRENTIHVTSDRLVAQSRADYAEFTGNVHAVSKDFDIQADSLQVFYSQAPEATPSRPDERQDKTAGKTVKEIIATGNVTILFSGKIAKTEKAVYSRETSLVVLMGAGSTVTGKSGRISGETITLNTENENVTVESGGQTRVQAVIHSEATENGNTTEK